MSTPEQRLDEACRTFDVAHANREADLIKAQGDNALIARVWANYHQAEAECEDAKYEVLSSTSPLAENAYKAAKAANNAVDAARERASALTKIVSLTGSAIEAVDKLVKAASTDRKPKPD